jgi:hypothetical protein
LFQTAPREFSQYKSYPPKFLCFHLFQTRLNIFIVFVNKVSCQMHVSGHSRDPINI